MSEENAPAYIFNTHVEAEDAIHSLSCAGVDLKKLSLVGKGYHTEEHPVRFYKARDRIKSWGSTGVFLGSIWGMLLASAMSVLPGIGLPVMAGPVVSTLLSALGGALVVGSLFALCAALRYSGLSNELVVEFETALKVDTYVLMVHGGAEDLAKVRSILANSKVLSGALAEVATA